MKITLNGEDREIDVGTTVGELVDEMAERGRKGVAAAVNGEVVRRSEMDGHVLEDGDAVELVGAVQGGSR